MLKSPPSTGGRDGPEERRGRFLELCDTAVTRQPRQFFRRRRTGRATGGNDGQRPVALGDRHRPVKSRRPGETVATPLRHRDDRPR